MIFTTHVGTLDQRHTNVDKWVSTKYTLNVDSGYVTFSNPAGQVRLSQADIEFIAQLCKE